MVKEKNFTSKVVKKLSTLIGVVVFLMFIGVDFVGVGTGFMGLIFDDDDKEETRLENDAMEENIKSEPNMVNLTDEASVDEIDKEIKTTNGKANMVGLLIMLPFLLAALGLVIWFFRKKSK